MEFYQTEKVEKAKQISFSSQRDGILHSRACARGTTDGFQFPMGWNSTVSLSSVRIQTPSFQFPMGWNSTNFCSISFLFPICFNSQWDGILHRKFNSRGRTMKSFNSQWDGILLICDKSPCLRRKIVSIPNGMEFYSIQRIVGAPPCLVSIPNGMEFYAMHEAGGKK